MFCNEENSTLAKSARKENVQLFRSHPWLLTWSTEWGASRRFNTYQKQSRIEMFSSAVDTKICVQRHQSCKLMDVFDAMFFNSQSFCDTPSSHIDPLEIILMAQHCQWTQKFGAMGVANSASKPLASSCGEEETVVKNLILFHCTLQQLPLQEINFLVSLVLVHQGSTRAYTGQCVDRWGWGIAVHIFP